jgi:hypothetical protein
MTLVISKGITLDNGTRAAAIAGVSPTLDYRFAREKREIETVSLTDKLTYTGGNGTFVGSDGFIQRATTNVPRFDHDPLSRQSLGLLSEVERTNLLLRSQEFENSVYGNVSGTVVRNANVEISPAGNNTADELVFPGANVGVVQSATVSVGVTYALSCWFKGTAGETIRFTANNLSGGGNITLSSAWQRFSIVAPATATPASINISTFGGATARNIYAWGAQLEAGTTPSTYIPTTTTAVTRTADSAVIDGTGVITGTYTLVEKPAGCAVVSGTNINLQPGFTAERVMVFPAALDAGQITAIRGAM